MQLALKIMIISQICFGLLHAENVTDANPESIRSELKDFIKNYHRNIELQFKRIEILEKHGPKSDAYAQYVEDEKEFRQSSFPINKKFVTSATKKRLNKQEVIQMAMAVDFHNGEGLDIKQKMQLEELLKDRINDLELKGIGPEHSLNSLWAKVLKVKPLNELDKINTLEKANVDYKKVIKEIIKQDQFDKFMLKYMSWGNLEYLMEFDEKKWKENKKQKNYNKLSVRVAMVDQLMSSGKLDGLKKNDVIQLLGTPKKHGYFSSYDLVYHLGRERGLLSIDSEWLGINFNAESVVKEYKLLRD